MPLPERCEKSQGGVEEGGGGWREKGLWVEGMVLQLLWEGGGPPKGSWGQTHIGGPSKDQIRIYSVFANASLINSKKYKIGNGIGNYFLINSQELRTGNFWAILRGRGKDTDGPIVDGIFY